MRRADHQAQQAHLVRQAREATAKAEHARSRGRNVEAAKLEVHAKQLQAEAARVAALVGAAAPGPWRRPRRPPMKAGISDATAKRAAQDAADADLRDES